MSTLDYLLIVLPGFIATVGLAWIAGQARTEARKARELAEAIVVRLDRASAAQHARDAAELALLRGLHRSSASAPASGVAASPPAEPPAPTSAAR